MATYYVRADGLLSRANKALAVDPTSAAMSLSLAGLLSCVSMSAFSDGDIIRFSSRGGQFNITNSPDTRIYLQGGVDSPIYYGVDEWVSPAVIDGGGIAGAGPLVYASSAALRRYDFTGIKLLNWRSSQWGIVANNAIIDIHHVSGAVGSGNTYVEGIGASVLTVRDIDDFSGFATHWVGLHDTAQLIMRRCNGIGGQANAIHSIDATACDIDIVSVTAPATGGTSAFLLQGTGSNLINRAKVNISRPAYAAFAHYEVTAGSGSEVTVNNSEVKILGPIAAGDNAVGFEVCYYTSAGKNGKITANNCAVYSPAKIDARAFGARLNEGAPACVGSLIMNNTTFHNLTRPFRISPGGIVTASHNCEYNSGSNSIVSGGVLTESGKITTDPKFTDVASGDLSLDPAAPCIGAGVDVGLTTDADGNAVPGAVGYDVGPYSYMPGWTVSDGILPLSAQPCKGHALPIGVGKITIFEGVASSSQIEEAK